MTRGSLITAAPRREPVRLDIAVAVGLALVLTVGWALKDWSRLSHMLLPDPDDMMRLAQVRDWIAGQGINDWTQYRLAPPNGSPMHWSRINDMGIAALILMAAPFVGQATAELVAVLVYPGLLFAAAMFLSARIARGLWGSSAGPVAAVLTALAYPGTTVFVPGRIDHHALQVVLIQLLVLLLMRAPCWRGGCATGAVAAISLVVGLETAPQVAALVAVMAMLWAMRGLAEQARLAGFAIGLGCATLFVLAFLRPAYWNPTLCDAFTPASSTAALTLAAALAVLAAATRRLPDWRSRLGAGALLGATALAAVLVAFPGCIEGPYGTMDPFLRSALMPFIEEANGIFAETNLARMIAIAGVLTAACVASVWMLLRQRQRWVVLLPIVAVIAVSELIMLFQVRGAYIGAPLAAPVMAGLVVVARRRKTRQLAATMAAWLVSAGIAYSTLPAQAARLIGGPATGDIAPPTAPVACSVGDTWAEVDRYPPGVVLAGTGIASDLIGATHHSTVGASYHRNNAGNMAMYRFFLSAPDRSREIARKWRADYVLFCPGDFSEIDVAHKYANSVAARLQRGEAPPWLEPLTLRDTPLRLYRVR
jgi:hypothetical protein